MMTAQEARRQIHHRRGVRLVVWVAINQQTSKPEARSEPISKARALRLLQGIPRKDAVRCAVDASGQVFLG